MDMFQEQQIEDYILEHNDYDLNRFITITFSRAYEKYKPIKQFDLTARWLTRLFSDCCGWFELVPELTENNRIHWHAQYRVKDWINYRRKLLPKVNRVGFISVSVSKSAQRVKEYLMKDVEVNKEVFEYPYLPITKENRKEVSKVILYRQAKARQKQEKEDQILDRLLKSDSDEPNESN